MSVNVRKPLLFSIIIPIYNVERYLAECLESVCIQSCGRFEVILVNDASPDDSDRIIRKYEHKLPNLTYIVHEQNMGLGSARNSGMRVASGTYFVFLDADDTLTGDALETLTQYLVAHPHTQCIRYNYNKIGAAGQVRPQPLSDISAMLPNDAAIYLFSLPCYACMNCVQSKFIRERGLFFGNMINEDVPWTVYLFANAEIRIFNRRIYNYRIRDGSITTDKKYDINVYVHAYRCAADRLTEQQRECFFEGCAEKVIQYCSFFLRKKKYPLTEDNAVFLRKLLDHLKPGGLKMSLKIIHLRIVLAVPAVNGFFRKLI